MSFDDVEKTVRLLSTENDYRHTRSIYKSYHMAEVVALLPLTVDVTGRANKKTAFWILNTGTCLVSDKQKSGIN